MGDVEGDVTEKTLVEGPRVFTWSRLKDAVVISLVIISGCVFHVLVQLFLDAHDRVLPESYKYGIETMLEIPIVVLSFAIYGGVHGLRKDSSRINHLMEGIGFVVENLIIVLPVLLSFTMLSEYLLGLTLFQLGILF